MFPKREDGKEPICAWELTWSNEWVVKIEKNNLVLYSEKYGWYGDKLSFQDDYLVTIIISEPPHWVRTDNKFLGIV
jgi:hypothetical protein